MAVGMAMEAGSRSLKQGMGKEEKRKKTERRWKCRESSASSWATKSLFTGASGPGWAAPSVSASLRLRSKSDMAAGGTERERVSTGAESWCHNYNSQDLERLPLIPSSLCSM
ncbi:hypothetical protein EYF80_063383 [Liparis tanakae]|uniref:Uncharacterized protein n=1 Tax=Liparis tanakae TaxID=230148 RepID=A0A4Z2ECC2_9TELE|nr:hypothetical protein EYF80_063383 [Liparis tanakae]